jgi:hypothetical protein
MYENLTSNQLRACLILNIDWDTLAPLTRWDRVLIKLELKIRHYSSKYEQLKTSTKSITS